MQKAREATGGMQKAREATSHFRGFCLVRIARMERVCEVRRAQPALRPSVAQPALCISGLVSDSTGPHASRGGVVTPSSRRGKAFRPRVQMHGRRAWPQEPLWSAQCPQQPSQHAGLLMEPHCRLHGQVLTGAQPLPLGPCGPHPICVCWVDCLVPVASWEPLV